MKSGEKPGYPRFKSSRRWHTIELANVDASTLKDRGHYYAIRIKGYLQNPVSFIMFDCYCIIES